MSNASLYPRFTRYLTLCLSAVALSACIIVEDFNGQFETAKQDACLSDLSADLYNNSFTKSLESYEDVTRALTLDNGANYLMIKENKNDKGGHLYRFKVESGIFITYRPSPAARSQFKKHYADSGIRLKEDTLTIPSLNEKTLQILAETASDESYWREDEKRLYNHRANPDCAFDDRDVSTLDIDLQK